MKITYSIAGQDCQPVKREGIYLEINHDQQSIIDQPAPHVGINNLYFAREDVAKIMGLLRAAPGITEGIPFDITITESGQSEVINMYLDMMQGFKRSKDGLTCSVKMLQSLDWLDDKATSFTLESMYNEVGVSSFKIDGITYQTYQEYFDKRVIFIPYVLSEIPDYRSAFMAIFSSIYIGSELYKVVKMIVQWSTPIVGTGTVMPVVQLIAEIVFALLLIATLLAMLIQMINCLIQSLKYHGAMLAVDMLKIISYKMGLVFESAIWEAYPLNQLAYLPEKYNPLEDSTTQNYSVMGIPINGFTKRGFTSPGYATSSIHDSTTPEVQKGYFNGVGSDFLRLTKTFCNGKIVIPDQTNNLVLERRDFYPASTPFVLPNIRQDWNGYNTDELYANIEIMFQGDLNDKNCIDKYEGTILQAITHQIITNDPRLVSLQGLRTIMIEASRGVRKEHLNIIERIVGDIEIVWHLIWDVFVIPLNVIIAAMNVVIAGINLLIAIWNLLMFVIGTIITAIQDLYRLINNLLGGSNGVGSVNTNNLTIKPLPFIKFVTFQSLQSSIFTDRIGALLLENDMVTTPKFLLVDTNRSEFTEAGGYSGQKRIAYIHEDNQRVVNSQYLWDNFYKIDAFVGPQNNRFTKISPATNHEGDENPIIIKLRDFKNLVSNPKFKDNFGEEVIAETVQWHIEKNGRTTLDFRKEGWLADPQNLDGIKRAEEININLAISTSLPNGQ